MTGHRPWRDIRKNRDPNDPELAAFRDAIDEALKIGELRQQRGVTQTDLATALGVRQPNVSRIERQEDLFVSTLRDYVEALGGELELSAVFGKERIPLTTGHKTIPA
ncbi:MAG: XRE family transcriptional regulator [Solirubrobacterales bacterium]